MPRGRPFNRVTRLVVDYGDPDSVKHAVEAVKQMKFGLAKSEVELGKLSDHIRALFLVRLLGELRLYPPRKKGMKIRWTSPKQRRYVMALLRRMAEKRLGRKLQPGDDISYVRTGHYGAGWYAEAVPQRKGLRIRVENVVEGEQGQRYQQFVSGRIGLGTSRRSMGRYAKPMQGFHKDRGWKPAQPIIARYMGMIEEYAQNEFERQLDAVARDATS